MTTAVTYRRQPWLPALNLLLAGGAAVLGVIAITSDDVASIPPAPTPALAPAPAPSPEVVAVPSAADLANEIAAFEACRQAKANEPC